ncbi:nitroreductase/quinone reductase family protein [Mycobacteroides abscessus]|nr:nitroreductase/quinone reductase family protein [Mycobacteroides abscessus]MDM2427118.1 nitroreductase/quinone reductase family protein [Mycobacteroides abscessus]MDM2432215.1 nitroreductase/quinone reductase family protein [Mycobacteroides abscessus]MDM2436732.1 nitroreductase/quinone reductase family protein [Mycobacteroides abscessus]MDM2438658.1 nitroreductase/quinone reductase family protein [Mycobacteroides abscessus]
MSKTRRKTLVGVFNHILTTYAQGFMSAFTNLHARTHGTPLGRVLDLYFPAPVFALTVRGRKSGEPRTVMLILTWDGGHIVVAGSNGGSPKLPAWYLNLRNAGRAVATINKKQVPVRFREVPDHDRDRYWEILSKNYRHFDTYKAMTSRKIPIGILEPMTS